MYPVLLAVACGLHNLSFCFSGQASGTRFDANNPKRILNIGTEPLIGYVVVTIDVNID